MKRLDRLIGTVPQSFIETVGRKLGHLVFRLDRRHRRIVEQNTAFVFPGRSPEDIRGLQRRIFEHFGIMVLEILQVPFLSRDQLTARVRVENERVLLQAMDHPRGCLLISAHLGNWELGLLAMAARLDSSVLTVAKPIKFKMLHRGLTALRSRFGNVVIFKKGAMPVMQKALRGGRTVAILIDQGVRRTEAVEVQFLGRCTMATPAAALLALRGRMPVVPIFCVRADGGHYVLKVQSPIVFERTGDLRKDIQAYTQALLHAVEEPIRAHAEQWFWFHKRWKRSHPALYPEYRELRRKKRLKKRLSA